MTEEDSDDDLIDQLFTAVTSYNMATFKGTLSAEHYRSLLTARDEAWAALSKRMAELRDAADAR